MTATQETLEFKTELKQLMDIIIHSLYSNKEIFLRELISNACDAIDKVRFEGLTQPELLEGDSDWKIKLTADKEAGTLTISDNGIGMNHETVIQNLGTIASSGTRAFLEELKAKGASADAPELIGQFGMGFYASFMVADKVTVVTRTAGAPDQAVRWESDGKGAYTLEPAERAGRGTDVTLHLREDEKEFLEDFRLRTIVRKYSDYTEHPIVMDVERTEGEGDEAKTVITEETLNSRKALWLRPTSEITVEEHEEFYRHIARSFDKPARTIHYSAEGTIEFKALLYIPQQRPFDFLSGRATRHLHLYIRRVFIMADCDALLPDYFRFVSGVVDSADLPLNVSREILQENRTLARIRKNLQSKILGELATMKDKDLENYLAFYKEFGPCLKEGVASDYENKDKLLELLVFESSKAEAGQYVDLKTYTERMPEGQKAIYYYVGEDRQALEHSPYLEALEAKGQEVILLTDPMDEWVLQNVFQYKETPFKAIDKGELEDEQDKEEKAKQAETFKGLFERLGQVLSEVKEVRLSSRLKDSAACLVKGERELNPNLQRMMSRMGLGGDMKPEPPVLELNAGHPVVQALQAIHTADPQDARVETFGRLLYDQAMVAEGSRVADPVAFARRINELILSVKN